MDAIPFEPVVRRASVHQTRVVKKVPFVELLGGRVQGVVSSGSDASRVYVSWVAAGTLDFYCSTNNNRRCGGLGGGSCKHIDSMLEQAVAQHGLAHVVAYLKLPGEADSYKPKALGHAITGSEVKEPAGAVFSRFLGYLRLLEQDAPTDPIPECAWFV